MVWRETGRIVAPVGRISPSNARHRGEHVSGALGRGAKPGCARRLVTIIKGILDVFEDVEQVVIGST